jgi:alpha-tubulin suppressor-like RCC1 family protein
MPPIPLDETLNFDTSVKTIGVALDDSFDTWRKMTNGTIDKVESLDLLLAGKADTATLSGYVTTGTTQTILGAKLFFGGTSASPKLKVHSTAGFYYDTSVPGLPAIGSNVSFTAPRLINSGSSITLNGLNYVLPETPVDGILKLTGSTLSWVDESVVASSAFTVTTTGMILPVGSVIPWAHAGVPAPEGWLVCDGSALEITEELAAVIGTTYGPVFDEGDIEVAAQGDTPPGYSATNKYTLPNLFESLGTELPPSPSIDVRYLIKSTEDPIVNFGIELDSTFTATNFSGAPISRLGINGGNLSVRFNPLVLKTGASGLDILEGGVTPAKLSIGAPSWNSSGRVTLLGEPTTASDATTKQYVDTLFQTIRVGEAAVFPEVSSGNKHSSAPMSHGFVWIDVNGDVNVNGAATYFRFGSTAKYGSETMSLPGGRKAVKVYVGDQFMAVIDDQGKPWAMGRNDANQFGMTVWDGLSAQTRWIRIFESIGTCTKILHCSGRDQLSLYALDSAGSLWSAGFNVYGQLGNGRTISTTAETSPEVTDPRQAHVVRTNVLDACVVGAWTGSGDGICNSVCVLQNDGTVFCVGYGQFGQMGNGLTTAINSTWAQVQTSSGVALTGISEIWSGGTSLYTSFYAKKSNDLYAWGYNGDGQFGNGTTTNSVYATKIWDANSRLENVVKFIPSQSSPVTSIVLTNLGNVYCAGQNNFGSFGLGTGAARITSFTQIPWASTPGTSGLTPVDVTCANNYVHIGPIFITAEDEDGQRSLWSCGYNYYGNAGIAAPINEFYSFQRVSIADEVVNQISDLMVQYSENSCLSTFLLLNNGTIHYCGQNHYNFDIGVAGGLRYSFTRIRTI